MPLLHVCVSSPSLQEHVPLLLENGADIHGLSTPGKLTVLHVAALTAPAAMVSLLLQSGAHIDSLDASGHPALRYAVESTNLDTIHTFLQHGANVCARDGAGWTVVHHAAEKASRQVMTALLEKAPVDILSRCGLTPLHCASHAWNEAAVDVLLRAGANVRSRRRGGGDNETPLCLAMTAPRPRGMKHCLQVVKALIDGGAPLVVYTGKERLTPLHRAAMHGFADAAACLLHAGADTYALSASHQTPLDLAKKHGHESVLRMYQKRADRCMNELLAGEEKEQKAKEEAVAKKKKKKQKKITSAFAAAAFMEEDLSGNNGLRLAVLSRQQNFTFAAYVGPAVDTWLCAREGMELNAEDAFAVKMLTSRFLHKKGTGMQGLRT